jgi:LAS superfamily LD-carboxypeptidase LdcB
VRVGVRCACFDLANADRDRDHAQPNGATDAIATPTKTASPSSSPTASPTPTRSPSPLPTATIVARAPYCAVADVVTPDRDYARPDATVLDWTHTLTRAYEPPDLVSALSGTPVPTTRALPDPGPGAADLLIVQGQPGYEAVLADDARAQVRKIAYADLAALRDAARAAGLRLVIVSAYRSYAQQEATFAYWVSVGGYEQALRTSARPGHSEHQLGTTLDFGDGSAAPWEYDDWAATPTGGWLAQHAREYGFVMTYPAGSSAVTCYDYEPWHYRWVGRDVAMRVTASARTLREFQTGIR